MSRIFANKTIIAAFLFFAAILPLYSDQNAMYREILRLDRSADSTQTEIIGKCSAYIKKYQRSSDIPEIHMIAARHESSSSKAISHYNEIIKKYPKYKEISSVYESACEILFLGSAFETCARHAKSALLTEKNQRSKKYFSMTLVRSLIFLQEYEAAKDTLSQYYDVIGKEEGAILSREITRRTGDKDENLSGFDKTLSPRELYQLAQKYEIERKYDYAFSAYKDLNHLYPRSPEAVISHGRLAALEKNSPKYSRAYTKNIYQRPDMRLSPEEPVSDAGEELAYSVLIGPLYNLAEAKKLKKEMTAGFDAVVLVKASDGFYLYIGRESTAERALSLKIRLAEEYALNGKIAQRKEDNGREYIYGK